MRRPSHSSRFDHLNNNGWGYRSLRDEHFWKIFG
jgi:hypothetical protein